MDKIAILSDVHGNLTALNAVLDDIKKRKVNKIYFLGDFMPKCARPDKVIDLLRDKCDVLLKGNCDDNVCKPEVKDRHFWSRELIGDERAEYINSLPIMTEFYLSGQLVRLFHASPISLYHIYNPAMIEEGLHHADSLSEWADMFKNTEFIGKTDNDPIPDVVGYGHIHTQNFMRYGNKTLFNCGSVGIPSEMLNDGDEKDDTNKFSTLANYAIIEGEFGSKKVGEIKFDFIRVPYDVKKEIELVEKSTMPAQLKKVVIQALKTACR